MAYSFDGTDDNLTTANNAVANADGADMTFAMWVNVRSQPADGTAETILCTGTAAAGTTIRSIQTINISAVETFRFVHAGTSTGNWRITSAEYTLDTWHHLAVTYNNSSSLNDPIIYMDGTSRSLTEVTNTATPTTGADTARFGESLTATADWDGQVAEAAQWNRILSADEIATLAKGYVPLWLPRGLVAYWPLDNRLAELMQGATLTASGGTVASAHPPKIIPFPKPRGAFKIVAGGGTTTSLSSSDGVFFLDLRTMDLRRTETDHALLSDAVLTQAIRARLADDGMFVSDSRVAAFYKTALDVILLGDETTKQVYRTLLDLLLLVDSVTVSQSGAIVNVVSVADAVFLLDLSVRSIASLHRDTMLMGDDRLTSIIRARFGDDGLFLTDTIRRVQSVILDDQMLLLDSIIKRLTKIVTDNPLLFSDDVTTALAQASAQALVYARLRTLGLFSPVRGVNDLLSLTTRSSDFMSIETGIVRPN